MTDHYFDAEPEVADVRSIVRARIWGSDHEFETSRGVFSRDRLDKATQILLAASPPPVAARAVLDLGCGWGPIACAIASECPDVAVDAIDTNTRALDLTRRNAVRAGVGDRVRATLPEDAEPGMAYDEIWSNPPIRIGKLALHDLLLTWLPTLTPTGVARLVVGKNLGSDSLQQWLVEQGWPTDRATSVKGFRVLVVRRG